MHHVLKTGSHEQKTFYFKEFCDSLEKIAFPLFAWSFYLKDTDEIGDNF